MEVEVEVEVPQVIRMREETEEAETETSSEDYSDLVGRQVGVKFNNSIDPGIIAAYDQVTGCFSVDVDDESYYNDIKFSELHFLD